MQGSRLRFGSAGEWVLAAVIILGTCGIASIVVREMRTVSAAMAPRESRVSAIPTGVPARAVSVPVLLLPDGETVRVGDRLSQVASRFDREAEVGAQMVEPGRLGDRLTRFYERAGTRFVLVFEPFARDGEPRVAAILLQ